MTRVKKTVLVIWSVWFLSVRTVIKSVYRWLTYSKVFKFLLSPLLYLRTTFCFYGYLLVDICVVSTF